MLVAFVTMERNKREAECIAAKNITKIVRLVSEQSQSALAAVAAVAAAKAKAKSKSCKMIKLSNCLFIYNYLLDEYKTFMEPIKT